MKLNNKIIWADIFDKNNDVVFRHIAGETILVPIKGTQTDMSKLFVLNPVAEYIWQQINGENKIREICDGILTKFDVKKTEAETDTQSFIAELLAENLITGLNNG